MNEITIKKEQNGKRNGKLTFPVLVAAIGGLLGGTFGPFVLVELGGPNILRKDPYTHTEATTAHALLDARITPLENHVDPRNHPDGELRAAIADIRAEMAASKAKQEIIIKNQDRIISNQERR